MMGSSMNENLRPRFLNSSPSDKSGCLIGVIMTVHNRSAKTDACLESLAHQEVPGIAVTVVDDGSTDGTAEMLRTSYPGVRVVQGDGNLYWARGMALAQSTALADDPDFILWLNDDVTLETGAVSSLLQLAKEFAGSIVVGASREPESRRISYAGLRRSWIRTRLIVVPPDSVKPLPVDSFHGNIVLVPRSAYRVLGTIDAAYKHPYGDLDYGLRATKRGIGCVLAPGFLGVCESNPTDGTWLDTKLSRARRFHELMGLKGKPLGPQLRFMRMNSPVMWSAWAVLTYTRWTVAILLKR